MKKKQKLQAEIFLPFEDKWVAMDVKRNKIVSSADNIFDLKKKLKAKRDRDIVLTYVERFDSYLSPNAGL